MKPGLKRVLVHAALTAVALAAIGYMFAEFAGSWLNTQSGRPASADLNPALPEGAHFRIPLMMAIWGFAFVVVGEFISARFRKAKPVERDQSAAAATEKLLNELLAKAEAESAAKPPTEPPVS